MPRKGHFLIDTFLILKYTLNSIPHNWINMELACKICSHVFDKDDLDFIYPQNRERTRWTAHCPCCQTDMNHHFDYQSFDETFERWMQISNGLTESDIVAINIDRQMESAHWLYDNEKLFENDFLK
jgi:hypothetical protein